MQNEFDLITRQLASEVAKQDRPENRTNYQRFSKDILADPISIRTAVLRRLSNSFFRKLAGLSVAEILDCCDCLLESKQKYMRFFAFEWALKVQDDFKKSDFARFERWLKSYVNDWGACDHLCCGPLGVLVCRFPNLSRRTLRWTRSRNRWMRRAAAVCLIPSLRNGNLITQAFSVADALLLDEDDLVQKGYGWMLKEASNRHRRVVFDFVLERKTEMPRTALRYAIEKMPAQMRKKAMAK